jgi:hypothetical protein
MFYYVVFAAVGLIVCLMGIIIEGNEARSTRYTDDFRAEARRNVRFCVYGLFASLLWPLAVIPAVGFGIYLLVKYAREGWK